ncbi:MAG: hypothetical protein C0424_01340 [Sphingobacteriaceae bacterium]|nr:hypothetical protein [Sphingobacteriaceae bacterium]
MSTVKALKTGLIQKIQFIQDKEFLMVLDELVAANGQQKAITDLTPEQRIMLEMSLEDLQEGRTITQEALMQRNLEWLNGK